jgi:hypothetical protein
MATRYGPFNHLRLTTMTIGLLLVAF